MEKTPIRKLRNIYKDLAKKNCKNLNNKTKYFNYLNLSVHNSRDDRDFDENNFNLLKFLLKKDKNNPNNYFFKKKNKISGYTKYLFSLKESNYLLSKKLPLFLIFDLLKYFKQFLDISGIILIISFKVIVNRFNFLNNKKFVLKNQKIYSIYYWIKKNSDSAKYYYPGYKEKSNKIFISSFADSKLFSKGLFLSLLNTNFITPAHILNIIELKISILQFLHLFFYDFYIVFFKRKANFYSIWIGWKKAAEIFL